MHERLTAQLTAALKAAAQAHSVYEQEIGRADYDWAPWYARWMIEHAAEFNDVVES